MPKNKTQYNKYMRVYMCEYRKKNRASIVEMKERLAYFEKNQKLSSSNEVYSLEFSEKEISLLFETLLSIEDTIREDCEFKTTQDFNGKGRTFLKNLGTHQPISPNINSASFFTERLKAPEEVAKAFDRLQTWEKLIDKISEIAQSLPPNFTKNVITCEKNQETKQ